MSGLTTNPERRRTSFISDGAPEKIRPALYKGEIPSIVNMHMLLVNLGDKSAFIYTSTRSFEKIKSKYKHSLVRYLGIVKRDPKPFNPYRLHLEDDDMWFDELDFSPALDNEVQIEEAVEDFEEVSATSEPVKENQQQQSGAYITAPDITQAPDFADFWEAYGIKKDRSRALEIWNTLDDQEKLQSIDGIDSYVKSLPNRYTQVSAWSYLNGRKWR